MKFFKKRKFVTFLLTSNLFLMCFLSYIIFTGFSNQGLFKTVETQRLIIKHPDEKAYIQMGLVKNDPTIFISDEDGNPRLQLEGGKSPSIVLKNKNNKPLAMINCNQKDSANIILHDSEGNRRFLIEGGKTPNLKILNDKKNPAIEMLVNETNESVLSLNDSSKISRLRMQSGIAPGIFMKNEKNKNIGSWATLSDGSAGFGLARSDGISSYIVKGGVNPGLAFFSNSNEPVASLGVMQNVSHLLITGQESEEVLIHGGKPMGMIIIDEKGQVKVYISKHGVFQGQEEQKAPEKKSNKFFSYEEDKKILFPDHKIKR